MMMNIINHLDRSRFAITLVVVGSPHGKLAADIPEDISVRYLNKKRVRNAIFDLIRLSWHLKPNLIFVSLSYFNLLLAIFKWSLPPQTLLVARETNVISKNNSAYRWPRLWNWLYGLFYKRIDHIVCQSRVMQLDMIQNFNVAKVKTSIIRNPLDISRLRQGVGSDRPGCVSADLKKDKPQKDKNIWTFVVVAKLRAEKNIDALIRAMTLTQNQNFLIRVIGDGDEEARLKDLVQKLGLADRVSFIGYLPSAYSEIFSADALILPSIYEGLPNVVLEALALQTQVIATPAGGVMVELFAKTSGVELAKSSSKQCIAEAIDRWIQRQPMKVDCRVVSDFDASKIINEYEKLFQRVSR